MSRLKTLGETWEGVARGEDCTGRSRRSTPIATQSMAWPDQLLKNRENNLVSNPIAQPPLINKWSRRKSGKVDLSD